MQRLLREMRRSTDQHFHALATNVHYLKGNIGAGAVRTAGPVTSTDPGSTPTTLTSLQLSLGRWVVMYRCQLTTSAHTDDAAYSMRVIAPGAVDAILPNSSIRMPGAGTLWMPFSEIGEFRNDEVVTVELQAWHTSGGAVRWGDAVLFCLPV